MKMNVLRIAVFCLALSFASCAKLRVTKLPKELNLMVAGYGSKSAVMQYNMEEYQGPIVHFKNMNTILKFPYNVVEDDQTAESANIMGEQTVIWWQLRTDHKNEACAFSFKVVTQANAVARWLHVSVEYIYLNMASTRIGPVSQVHALEVNKTTSEKNEVSFIKANGFEGDYKSYEYRVEIAPRPKVTKYTNELVIMKNAETSQMPEKVTVTTPNGSAEVDKYQKLDFVIAVENKSVSVSGELNSLTITLLERII